MDLLRNGIVPEGPPAGRDDFPPDRMPVYRLPKIRASFEPNIRMKRNVSCALLLAISFHANAIAETSAEYALMGRSFWSAFTCSVLAGLMQDQKEAERLFRYGYEQGQAFISGARSGKILGRRCKKKVPIGVTMKLEGPSIDFMLGRIFSDAQEWAFDKTVPPDLGDYSDGRRRAARSKYLDGNCGLIRNGK